MKLIVSILLAVLILFTGCLYEESFTTGCVESILEESKMTKYTGQEIGCKFYIELYVYKDNQYFWTGNDCADMITYPFDCAGNELCLDEDEEECQDFALNAVRIGIIGIED